jgi:hypothetical protein
VTPEGYNSRLDEAVIVFGQAGPESPSTHGNRPELLSDAWPTPTAVTRVRNEETMEKCLKFRQSNGQTTVPLYLEERVNIEEKNCPESWATPRPPNGGQTTSGAEDKKTKRQVMLQHQVESWATPEGMAGGKTSRGGKRKNELLLTGQVKQDASGKLNPRWVCVLMNLPVFWVKP